MAADLRFQDELLPRIESLVNQHMQSYKDPSHDWLHVDRVRRLALKIAADVNQSGPDSVDVQIVELGALVHDLYDNKFKDEAVPEDDPRIEVGRLLDAGADFGLSGYQSATVKSIMQELGYSKEQRRLREGTQTAWHKTCLEFHCVQDADMLDAMGSIGVMRTVAYGCRQKDRVLVMPRQLDASLGDEAQRQAMAFHFYEKLLKLKDCMKTRLGEEMARRRHEVMVLFLEELSEEALV